MGTTLLKAAPNDHENNQSIPVNQAAARMNTHFDDQIESTKVVDLLDLATAAVNIADVECQAAGLDFAHG